PLWQFDFRRGTFAAKGFILPHWSYDMRAGCHRILIRVVFILALLVAVPLYAQAPYDLVIYNGKVIDGSGNPWFYADVAILNGKIVRITQSGATAGLPSSARAKREIDAKGLIVAPGFIDMHSHSDTVLLEDGLAQSKIRQG